MAYTPLMDLFHQHTFKAARTERERRVMSVYRTKLRQAERFVLDDEAVKLICHLSSEHKKFDGWAFLARLPFDTMWVEFNLHTKVAEFEKMGTLKEPFREREVSPVIGYLFYRDQPNDKMSCSWVCHQVCVLEDGGPVLGALDYVFDPEGSAISPMRGSKFWHSPTLSLIPDFPRAQGQDPVTKKLFTFDPEYLLCGDFIAVHNEDGEGAWHDLTVPDWFIPRCAIIEDPWWVQKFSTPPRTMKRLRETEVSECKELAGTVRWIVAMLAAFNALPRDLKPVATRPGRKAVGMNSVPYFQHRNLTIKLPRDNRVVWAARQMDRIARNSKRPWHRVSGHWRVVDRGRQIGHICRHLPVEVDHGLGLCERCEMLIRWIPNHTRGDSNIGIIEHDTYRVEA